MTTPSPRPPTSGLQHALFRALVTATTRGPGALDQKSLAELHRAVSDALAEYAVPNEHLAEQRRLIGIVLRRLRQGLYGLGAAGMGVTLTAMFAGSVTGASILAGFAASLVALLVGVLLEMLERPT